MDSKVSPWVLSSFSLFALFMFVFGLPARATDYTNTNFIVRDPVITAEGGRSTTSNFEYFSSSGQTTAGQSSSTDFIHRAGFLYFPTGSSPSPTPSPTPTPSPSPSGGGTTGKAIPSTSVTFEGKAGAGSAVVLLKDAQIATKIVVDSTGNFLIQIGGLSTGNYIFGLYEETKEGRRSALRIFPIFVLTGTTITRTGISFEPGVFVVPGQPNRGDLNGDFFVGLIDFSILIYWFDRPNPPAHIDFDGNGKVDLVDFSIMAYYWTG